LPVGVENAPLSPHQGKLEVLPKVVDGLLGSCLTGTTTAFWVSEYGLDGNDDGQPAAVTHQHDTSRIRISRPPKVPNLLPGREAIMESDRGNRNVFMPSCIQHRGN
jgi:hypothetical protein